MAEAEAAEDSKHANDCDSKPLLKLKFPLRLTLLKIKYVNVLGHQQNGIPNTLFTCVYCSAFFVGGMERMSDNFFVTLQGTANSFLAHIYYKGHSLSPPTSLQ